MRKLYSRFFLGLFALLCSYASMAQVTVTATAGTMGPTNYTTVRAAFTAVNAGTHQGAVTVTVTANTTEPFAALLNKSGTGPASYTSLTLKPGTGASPTISGTSDTAVLIIAGDNVTIDGSNNATTSRNLTVANLDTSKVAAIGVVSAGTTFTNNVTVKNVIARNATIGIGMLDGTTLGAGRFTNVVVQNNSIQNVYYGIFAQLTPAATNGNGLSITGNDLTSTGANAIFSMGIYLQGADGSSITNNLVGNFNSVQNEDDYGIWVASGSKNIVVDGNRITNLTHTGGQGYGAHGIRITTATANANVRVSNNMIAGIAGDGWDYTSQFGADNPFGIYLSAASTSPQSGINVYHNSINLTGNTLNQTGAISVGIYVAGSTTANVVNNIINNNLGLQGTLGYGAVGILATAGAAQFSTINFNDYWVNPTGSGAKVIGQVATTAYNTLAGWQTIIAGEAGGKNVQPNFQSATDLHLNVASNPGLDNLGTPLASVTTDIDGNTRSTTTPDMGADEFTSTATCTNPVIGTQPVAQTICAGANINLSVTATGTGLTYQWRRNGSNITGATSATYTKTGAVTGDAGNYDVVVSSGACSVTSNAVAVTVNAATAITTQPASRNACFGTSTTFTVAATGGGLTYQWRKNGANVTTGTGGTTNSYTLTNLAAGDAGNYDVVITGTCGNVTSTAATLTVTACTSVPNVDDQITSIVMTPNVVRDVANVRVNAVKATKISWNIVDAQGKIVMTISSQVAPGKNDIALYVGQLSNGTYQLKGATAKGATSVIRFVKM